MHLNKRLYLDAMTVVVAATVDTMTVIDAKINEVNEPFFIL